MNQDIYNYGKEIKFTNLKSWAGGPQLFKDCTLDKCTFKDSRPIVEMENCLYLYSDLSNCNFSESCFYRVDFIDCKFNGSNFHGAELYHVNFVNCSGIIHYSLYTRTRSTLIFLNPIDDVPILFDSKEVGREFYGKEINKIKSKYVKSFIETVKINSSTFRKALEM